MEHVGAWSFRVPLTSVRILVAEEDSHAYLYGQVLRLDPFFRFSIPSVGLQVLGRVGNLENVSWLSHGVKPWIDLLNWADPKLLAAV
jgi:hypothetical protein